MNDAQPRPSDSDGPDAPDGTQLPVGAESGSDTPVLTRQIPPPIDMVTLLGPRDELLRTMERQFPLVDTHVRGNEMTFAGPAGELEIIDTLVDELLTIVSTGQPLNRDAVERSISMLRGQTAERPADVLTMNIVSSRGRTIRPKTLNQKRYVDAIDEHTVVFGIGPAGTGKTYLAMAKAVAALQAKQVNRIILTRPAVEAGERLGFLPGTLNDKIDPYLRPLYDALHDMVSPETIPRLMASGTIEVAPLAYMRGRTLNDAFIILDEAQNTSSEQMKMFLTRLGFGSKMVVTGDITQVDLPGGTRSGLRVVRDILEGVEDVHFAELTSHDVVRHRLVSAIVDAYERDEVRAERRARSRAASGDHRDHRGSRRNSDRSPDRGADRDDHGRDHRDDRDDHGGRRDATEAGA
ncbi:phosphate starvation-inducible protein PhoH [Terrabacter sp. Soil811]|uniref:PhoH family protein n=1 Tax=Terrabacter sp. Soil811 TaxID=1736419 RepID=UPI0006FF3CF5|nr:PhoH family protein [Terrabacter sp. Soil811]KRF42139.1 phosphate starvation-inducible protein PhoH [Terrabacter sp. Soil811]